MVPGRDGPGALPNGESSWDAVAVAVAAVTWKMPKYKEMFTFYKVGMSQNSGNRHFPEIKAPAGASHTRLPFHILLPQN